MREIKFRGWDGSKMLPPEDLSVGPWNRKWLSIIDVELMQYTGIKDKNGVEIYEGDIVAHEIYCTFPSDYYTGDPGESDGNYKTIGHITITPSKGITLNGKRFFTPECGDMVCKKFNANPRLWNKHAKVIGNIHENPELLEKK